MMWDEQLKIIKNWTYDFTSAVRSDRKHVGLIVYSRNFLTINDRTRPCSLHHNMIDDAFIRVRRQIRGITRKIEAEKNAKQQQQT